MTGSSRRRWTRSQPSEWGDSPVGRAVPHLARSITRLTLHDFATANVGTTSS
jgi:hypothetical protein